MKKTATQYHFTSLNAVIAKRIKSAQFRKAFSEEAGKLQLAHEIKTLRQRRNMTQKQVALRADMPQSVIARIESGTHSVSITTLHKIARVFNKHVGLVEYTQNHR